MVVFHITYQCSKRPTDTFCTDTISREYDNLCAPSARAVSFCVDHRMGRCDFWHLHGASCALWAYVWWSISSDKWYIWRASVRCAYNCVSVCRKKKQYSLHQKNKKPSATLTVNDVFDLNNFPHMSQTNERLLCWTGSLQWIRFWWFTNEHFSANVLLQSLKSHVSRLLSLCQTRLCTVSELHLLNDLPHVWQTIGCGGLARV